MTVRTVCRKRDWKVGTLSVDDLGAVALRRVCGVRVVCRSDNQGMTSTGWQSFWHLHPGVRSGDQLTLGERAADRMRNTMGSWPFVFGFFLVMIGWAIVNSVFYLGGRHGKHGFDPYPYILLNLFLSMLAGVQAAALLIAAKRSDAIASEIAVHTERNTDDLKTLLAENTSLTEEVKRQTDVLDEIHRHVAALTPLAGRFPPGGQPPPRTPS